MVFYYQGEQVIQNMLFLGALRSAAQMLSYEVSIGFTIITLFMCVGSLDFISIVLIQEKV